MRFFVSTGMGGGGDIWGFGRGCQSWDKKALPDTKENAKFIDRLLDYPNGFYAHLPKESRIKSKRDVSKYVGRYVRHPAIANYRLYGYDGEKVTFWYIRQSRRDSFQNNGCV